MKNKNNKVGNPVIEDQEDAVRSAFNLASVPFNSFIPEGEMRYDKTVFDRAH